jgi:hypothetical protein
VAVVVFALNGLSGGIRGPSATPSPTAGTSSSSTPTAAATLDLGSLAKPVRDQVIAYREACGPDAPLPPDIGSMNKKQAEAYFGPRIDACGGGGD